MADELLASVVVVVEGDRRIYRFIESLLKQTVSQDAYEIIVVENGTSQLRNVGVVGGGTVQYLQVGKANMAAARNLGLQAARGRYLLTTDADVVVQPEWIKRMTEALDRGVYTAVGGPIHKFEPKTWTQKYAITIVDGQNELNYLPALPLPYVAGANAGFVTDALRAVGGFDERFESGNDVDVCYRLGLSGYKVGLAPDAIVFHEDRRDLSAHFRRFKRYAIYQVLLFATYRHVSHRWFVINGYPMRRAAQALALAPRALAGLAVGDVGSASQLVLQLVEAFAVWCGDIQGSIRYRQFYL